MLRVGLDARTMFSAAPRGTGRNLRDAYAHIPVLRPDWQFVHYHRAPALGSDAEGGAPAPPNVRRRALRCPGDRWSAWFHARLPLQALLDRVDLMHYPANAVPRWRPTPYVVTIHDLIPLRVPGETDPRGRRAFARSIRTAARSAAAIITPSAATRDELLEHFAPVHAPVFVVPWAADAHIAAQASRVTPAEVDATCRRYGVTPPYVLNFSGDSPRKNAHGLVRAAAQLGTTPLCVVLTGCAPEPFRAALEREALRLGCAARCRFLPFVAHEDLAALLVGASVLAIPSLHEGFGLPVLDAFACGVPVVAGDTAALREVAGPAARYCRPRDAADIAAAIEDAARPALRAALIRRGRERLNDFQWTRTAEQMCAVYAEACARSRATGRAPADAVPRVAGVVT